MQALLDVNVLIALLDENHTHHATVSDWFADHIEHGWASCPLTQHGYVRIVSQPRYPNALRVAKRSCGFRKPSPLHGTNSFPTT